MVIKYDRTAAYVCPFCSSISKKSFTPFSFSAKGSVKLVCPTNGCKEECAVITLKNNKIRLSVECPVCGDTHSFSSGADKFWKKPVITFQCPASGADIMFCGEDKRVDNIINAADFEDAINEFSDIDEPDILIEMLDIVHELKEAHKISCLCGGNNISVQVINNSIALICNRCRRIRAIEANEENLVMLLNAEEIVIGN